MIPMTCGIKTVLARSARQVVSVNGVIIAHDAISREAQNHPAPTPVLAWAAATRALAVRELLLQEARGCGLHADPITDDAARRETEDEALVRGLIESRVTTPSPDEATCRRYYKNNRGRFRSADIFECSHILVAARRDQPQAFAAARNRACAILAQLCDQPNKFATLANAHSDCPSRDYGGNLGQLTRGATTPEFERAMFALKPGACRLIRPNQSKGRQSINKLWS
jgi:peptidyl-prolyl cis-trans isomerase C